MASVLEPCPGLSLSVLDSLSDSVSLSVGEPVVELDAAEPPVTDSLTDWLSGVNVSLDGLRGRPPFLPFSALAVCCAITALRAR